MKLSDDTVQVLKNFSTINQNIVFKSGNNVSTISEARNILTTASISESIPQDFGVYDLNQFLGVLGLVDEPEVKFEEKFATVGDATGRSRVKYFFTDIEMLTAPGEQMLDKAKSMDNFEVKFVLDQGTFNGLKKAAGALGHSSVSITPNNGSISLTVFEPEDSTSNSYTIDVPGTYDEDSTFKFVISINNLKILPGDYNVSLSSKLMSKFSHKEKDIQYWIALEKTSTYGE
jgi:hypothetical protein